MQKVIQCSAESARDLFSSKELGSAPGERCQCMFELVHRNWDEFLSQEAFRCWRRDDVLGGGNGGLDIAVNPFVYCEAIHLASRYHW